MINILEILLKLNCKKEEKERKKEGRNLLSGALKVIEP